MIRRMSATVVAAWLCVALTACDHHADPAAPAPAPTPLPDAITISAASTAQVGTGSTFSTTLGAQAQGLSYRWDFGDGTVDNGPQPVHAYSLPGDYTVTVAVTNDAEVLRTATFQLQAGRFGNVAGQSCSGPQGSGWCWQDVLLTGHAFVDATFVDDLHGWAVGAHGVVAATVDGGDTWTLQDSGTIADLQQVRFADVHEGWILSAGTTLLHTMDGGATWSPAAIPPDAYYLQFARVTPGTLALSSWYSGMRVTHDHGATWSRADGNGYAAIVTDTDCWFFAGAQVSRAAGCANPSVPVDLVQHGGGWFADTFTGSFSSTARGLALDSIYDYSLGTSTVQAWETLDGGTTWTGFAPAGLPADGVGYQLDPTMFGDAGWMLAYFGPRQLLHTQDGARHWTVLSADTSNVTTFGFIDGATAWRQVDNHFDLTRDGGVHWTQMGVPAETSTMAGQVLAWSADDSHVVLYVDGRVWVTRDAGEHWTLRLGRLATGLGYGQQTAMAFTDAQHGIVVSSDGSIRRTTDGGQHWSRQDFAGVNPFAPVGVRMVSPSAGWLMWNQAVYQTADGGATWSMPLAGGTTLAGAFAMNWLDASVGHVLASGGLLRTTDGGAHWVSVPLPLSNSGFSDVAFTSASNGVLLAYDSGVFTTSDGGATWTARGVLSGSGSSPRLRTASGSIVWALANGDIWRSVDDGQHFQAQPSLRAQGAVDVAFGDAMHGWVIDQQGGAYATTDGGRNWVARSLGGDIALSSVAAADGMTAWISTAQGPILATASGGR